MHRDFNTCGKAGLFDPWKAGGGVAGTGLKYHTARCPDKVPDALQERPGLTAPWARR